MLQIQKTGANMQSLKKKGNGAVGGENEGSYAICPIFFTYIFSVSIRSKFAIT